MSTSTITSVYSNTRIASFRVASAVVVVVRRAWRVSRLGVT
jgi:hypothetical protein